MKGFDNLPLIIAQRSVDHYQGESAFYQQQCDAIADVLQQVIEIVGFEPEPPYNEPLFRGFYSVPRLLEHIRLLTLAPKEK